MYPFYKDFGLFGLAFFLLSMVVFTDFYTKRQELEVSRDLSSMRYS